MLTVLCGRTAGECNQRMPWLWLWLWLWLQLWLGEWQTAGRPAPARAPAGECNQRMPWLWLWLWLRLMQWQRAKPPAVRRKGQRQLKSHLKCIPAEIPTKTPLQVLKLLQHLCLGSDCAALGRAPCTHNASAVMGDHQYAEHFAHCVLEVSGLLGAALEKHD